MQMGNPVILEKNYFTSAKGSIGIFPFGIRSLDEGLGLAITKELVAQGVRGAQFDVSKSRGWLG